MYKLCVFDSLASIVTSAVEQCYFGMKCSAQKICLVFWAWHNSITSWNYLLLISHRKLIDYGVFFDCENIIRILYMSIIYAQTLFLSADTICEANIFLIAKLSKRNCKFMLRKLYIEPMYCYSGEKQKGFIARTET